MQKKFIVALVAGVAAATVAGSGAASAMELVYGAGIPAKANEVVHGITPYTEDLTKRTNGELTFKVVAGAQVVSLQDTLGQLRNGIINMGLVVPAFTRKELPHINVLYDSEMFGDDVAAISGALNETILLNCPECLKDFADNNAVILGSFGVGGKGLICRKPINTLADVKGLKIRAIGPTAKLMEKLGGVPVVMAPTDATAALGNGTIDCVHALLPWLKTFGYWDTAKHMLEGTLGVPRGISHVNFARSTWDKMSAAQKKAAIDAVPASVARMVYDVTVDAERMIKEEAIKAHGVKFTTAGKDFYDVVDAFRAEEKKNFAKMEDEQLGIKDSQKVLDTFLDLLNNKWNKLAKDNNLMEDKAKMTEIYKREIFDKVDPSKL